MRLETTLKNILYISVKVYNSIIDNKVNHRPPRANFFFFFFFNYSTSAVIDIIPGLCTFVLIEQSKVKIVHNDPDFSAILKFAIPTNKRKRKNK